MRISSRQFTDVTVMDVSGRIVAGEEATLFHNTIREAIARGRKNILLNLAEVPYIDSAGIGELASGFVALKRVGGCLKLLNLSRRVREVLEIVHLVTVFQIFDSEAEALATFAPPQERVRELSANAG